MSVLPNNQTSLTTTPLNKALEEGSWTQSIIWGPRAPFRDFTRLELNEDDIIPEERHSSTCFGPITLDDLLAYVFPAENRPRKRLRTDTGPARDKFNLSNDQFYEVSKDGGRHRVRQTFGQLVVEHAYPAQKLQLPFVRTSAAPFRDLLLTYFYSSRLAYRSRKLVRSTGPPCSSLPTLN